VVYRTVVEHRHKASGLLFTPMWPPPAAPSPFFCRLPVAAAELIDRAGLAR
jgi:D-lactate dehydrogenase